MKRAPCLHPASTACCCAVAGRGAPPRSCHDRRPPPRARGGSKQRSVSATLRAYPCCVSARGAFRPPPLCTHLDRFQDCDRGVLVAERLAVAAGRRRRSGGSPAGRGGAPARLRPGYQPPREASVPWRAAALWPGGRCGGPPRAAAAAFALEGCARQRVAAAPAPLPPPPEQRLGAPRIVIPVLLNEFHNYGGRAAQAHVARVFAPRPEPTMAE
jgi:hypothetical protein